MNFIDLYRYADMALKAPISVEILRKKVNTDHSSVNDVIFYECDLDEQISRGHMILSLEKSSPYGDSFIVASIRFAKTLNTCWARFVCCKELMHVFDDSLSKTSSREKFIELLEELENNPLTVSASERFASERIAEWQALFVLCPKTIRLECKKKFQEGQKRRDIADFLQIPEVYIGTILSDRYEYYHEKIVGEPV